MKSSLFIVSIQIQSVSTTLSSVRLSEIYISIHPSIHSSIVPAVVLPTVIAFASLRRRDAEQQRVVHIHRPCKLPILYQPQVLLLPNIPHLHRGRSMLQFRNSNLFFLFVPSRSWQNRRLSLSQWKNRFKAPVSPSTHLGRGSAVLPTDSVQADRDRGRRVPCAKTDLR